MKFLSFLILASLAFLPSLSSAQKVSDLPNASIPLSGAELLSLTQGGASVKTAVSNIVSLANSTLKTASFVSSNAGLMALPAISVPFTSAVRLGFAAAGDAPPLVYIASGSACSLNGGLGDNGLQVPSANGNCWIASFPSTEGVDIGEWGTVCGADDSAIWSTIDATMGSSSWPAQVAKTAVVPACSTPAQVSFSNIQRITGTQHVSTLTCTSTQGITGSCWTYNGNGPLQLDNLVIGCQSYIDTVAVGGHMVQPPNCGDYTFSVSPATVTTYPRKIVTRNVDLIGGNQAFKTFQAADIDLEFDKAWDVYTNPVGISIQNVSNTGGLAGNLLPASRSQVIIKDCRSPGAYCLSFPVTFPPSTSTYEGIWGTPVDFYFDVHCVGAGFIGSKGCVDATGNAVSGIHGRLVAYDSYFGFESKTGNIGGLPPFPANAIPPVYQNRYFDADVHESFEAQACAMFNYEISVASGSLQIENLRAVINCTYTPAAPWIASFPYNKGDVYLSTDGETYIVLRTNNGLSGTVAPTGGSRNNFSIADGNLIVQCVCIAAPTEAQGLVGAILEGSDGADLDVTVHGAALGVALTTRGETNTISNATIKLRGTVSKTCVQDEFLSDNPNTANGQLTNVTLDGNCMVVGTQQCDPTALNLGNSNGSSLNNYTNLTIRGDWQELNAGTGASCTNGWGMRTNAGTVAGNIMGAHISGFTNAFFLNGPVSLSLIGGLVSNSGGVDTVIRQTSSGSGTVVVQPSVAVSNSDPSGFADWVGGPITISGQFFDPPTSGAPTTKCNIGQVSVKVGAAGLWGCTATNTWGSLY